MPSLARLNRYLRKAPSLLAYTSLLLPMLSHAAPFGYPKPPQSDQVDDYHGTKVPDPYRPLEDANAPATQAWVEAENKITFDYLRHIPARDGIHERVAKLWDYEKYGVPQKEGGLYFYSKNSGLQNQSVIYVARSLDAEPTELLDPNKLSADGTVSLESDAISKDGKYMAYGLHASGSDWIDWHVRDVATARDLPDHLQWSKFSGLSWTTDGKGFFYSRYDEPDARTQLQTVNYYQKLFYHVVGTEQAKDALVYERPDQKEWIFGGDVTEDGQYLIIDVSQGTDPKNRVFFRPLKDGPTGAPVVELLKRRRRALCVRRQRRDGVLLLHGPRRGARPAGGDGCRRADRRDVA